MPDERRPPTDVDQLLELVPDAVVVVDASGRIRVANDAAHELLGYAEGELVGEPMEILVPERLRAEHAQHRARYAEQPRRRPMAKGLELAARRKDGSEVPVLISLGPVTTERGPEVLATLRDLTARKELDERVFEAQKMEAIGRLAGGVAHDFNNALSVVLGYSALLIESLPAGHPASSDLVEIERAAIRARDVTKQLLAFSRKQVFEMSVIEVDALLDHASPRMRALLGGGVDLRLVLGARGATIRADAAQIEQVVANLVRNARDATPPGGAIAIESSTLAIDDDDARALEGVAPGRFVRIAVRDEGAGMSAETQARVFEPFFTTKELGQGAGLGLSAAFGIVRQSRGTITVTSREGQGSTFAVLLPAHERARPEKL